MEQNKISPEQANKIEEMLASRKFKKEHLEESMKVKMSDLTFQDASDLIDCMTNGDSLAEIAMEITQRHADGEVTHIPKKYKPDVKNAGYIELVEGRWNSKQIQLIHDAFAKGTTEEEFQLFLYTAWKMGLDPLLKEIWCIKIGSDPATITASFSGLLKRAKGSQEWEGFNITMDPPESELKPGEHPNSITCTMPRKGLENPVVFTAKYSEFVRRRKDGSITKTWETMPTVMLRKCAIMNALRQTYPDHIGSIYSPEELQPE